MALQIWLPLNGDLKNRGLASIPALSLSSLTFDDNGKIGKCLKIPKITTNNIVIPELQGVKKFSFSCWLYLDTNLTNSSYTRIFSLGHTSDGENGYIRIETIPTNGEFQIIYNKSASHGGGGYATVVYYNITGGPTASAKNKWVHVTVTNDGTNVRTYFNGELKGTWAVNTIYDTGSLNGNFYLGGSYVNLNDVRIYDHCLSAKEVKEISKALVLHYRLAGPGGANLAQNTNIDSTSYFGLAEQAGGSTRNITYDNGIPCVTITRNTTPHSGWAYIFHNSVNLNSIKTNTTYTVSLDIKASVSGYMSFVGLVNGNAKDFMTHSISAVQSRYEANTWSHIVFTCQTISDFSNITVGAQVIYFGSSGLLNEGTVFSVKNIKLEEGLVATPWIPNSADALYTALGYNDNIEYDCSGYRNNGIKSGNIAWDIESPRYTTSYKFNGSSCIKNNQFYFNSNIWTVSLWYKYNTAPTAYEGIICLSKYDGSDLNKKIAIMPNSNFIWIKTEDNSITSSLKVGEWCHLAIVSNGASAIIYENGIQKGTTTISSSITDAYDLVIGARASSTGAATTSVYNKGNISDVRIYATALSANDIIELYHTAAMVDNGNNLYTYEYVEEEVHA